jgi:heat-inducible transcriptional repressor
MTPRKSLLLDEIIREYLKQQEPIGSESLRLSLNIKISSATIRNHFKTLVEEGALAQPHVSSGRIPTELALKNYWRKKLLPLEMLEFESLKKIEQSARETGIFCALRFYKPNFLQEVVSVGTRFLVLGFEEGEAVVKYSGAMERFLGELVGLEIRDIRKIAYQVCAHELASKLDHLLEGEPVLTFGLKELAELLQPSREGERLFHDISKGKWLDTLEEGLYFDRFIPRGALAFIQQIRVEKSAAKLMFMGSLNRNYEAFYQEALA